MFDFCRTFGPALQLFCRTFIEKVGLSEAMLKSPLVHSEILWTWNVVEYSQALLLFLVSPCLDHIISWLPLGTDVDILSSLLCRMDDRVDVS